MHTIGLERVCVRVGVIHHDSPLSVRAGLSSRCVPRRVCGHQGYSLAAMVDQEVSAGLSIKCVLFWPRMVADLHSATLGRRELAALFVSSGYRNRYSFRLVVDILRRMQPRYWRHVTLAGAAALVILALWGLQSAVAKWKYGANLSLAVHAALEREAVAAPGSIT